MKLGKQVSKRLNNGTIYYDLIYAFSDGPFYIRNNWLIHQLSGVVAEEMKKHELRV